MPHAMHACVISKTPHASPPQKIARKGLEDVADAADAVDADDIGKLRFSIMSRLTGPDYLDERAAETSDSGQND